MQPLQVCTVSNRKLEDADENEQLGKAKLMQLMRLYVYSDPSTLRTHLKRYSGERSTTCNQCDFASSRAGDLRRHLKTHIGEKSNKCNQCDFVSTQAGNLRRHLKTHSGEKSGKCNQCNFASTWPADLRIHFISHSGIKPVTSLSQCMCELQSLI